MDSGNNNQIQPISLTQYQRDGAAQLLSIMQTIPPAHPEIFKLVRRIVSQDTPPDPDILVFFSQEFAPIIEGALKLSENSREAVRRCRLLKPLSDQS
jgi:hypothetical protein